MLTADRHNPPDFRAPRRNATVEDFEHVIRVLNQFPTESFITHSVDFTEMIENFDSWLDPKTGVIKATVSFN